MVLAEKAAIPALRALAARADSTDLLDRLRLVWPRMRLLQQRLRTELTARTAKRSRLPQATEGRVDVATALPKAMAAMVASVVPAGQLVMGAMAAMAGWL